jgi:hypothetical protein
MKRFFFDLAGEFPARDFLGHECSSKKKLNATLRSLPTASELRSPALPNLATE